MALYPFPLSGHDAHVHLDWIEEFDRLRDSGILYPRWLPLSFGGFGATTFYFYPPLTYYLGDFFHSLSSGLSITAIYHLLELTAVIASMVAMYAYLRESGFSKQASWIAAAVIGTALYRFWDVFMRNALAEQMAIAWLPVIFLAIDYGLRQERSYKLRSFALSAIGWAGLILTNIPTLVLLLFTAPIYGLIRARFRVTSVVPAVLGAMLGAVISAVYILPVIELKQYVQTGHLFDFFLPNDRWSFTLHEMFLPYVTKTGMDMIVPLTMAGGIAAALYVWRSQRIEKSFRMAWIVVAALALFLQLPFISLPIWDHVAPLQLIQFSWRWCGVLLFVPAVGIATLVDKHAKPSFASWSARLVTIGYVAIAAIWYARYVYIVLTFPLPPPMVDPGRTGAPEHVPIFANFTLDQRTSIAYAVRRLDEPAVMPEDSNLHATLVADHGIARTYRVEARVASRVRFHLYYWPYWKLSVDGKPIETTPDTHGIMTATLPAGQYAAKLHLVPAKSERWGPWISLAGIAMLVVACGIGMNLEWKARRA
jgi:hypothetical protein